MTDEEKKEKQREYQKRYYQEHKEKKSIQAKKRREANPEKYREMGRISREKNKEKRNEYGRKYYQDNKETISKKHRRYRIDNAEKIRQSSRARYQNNPDYYKNYRAEHADKNNEYGKQYRKEKNGRAKSLSASYNQKDVIRGFDISNNITEDWIVENLFNGQKCIYCGDDDWEHLGADRIDNTKPHTPDNVVCCCGLCNIEKNDNYTVEEFKQYRALHPRDLSCVPEKSWEIAELPNGTKVLKKKQGDFLHYFK